MKKIAIIIWLILLMQAVAFAQNKNESLYIVKRFASEVTLDPIQEMALKVSNIRSAEVDKTKMKIVIRLCTEKRMQIAVLKSVWLYPTIIETLEDYGFEKKNIVVLKSADCMSAENGSNTPTEVWVSNQENLLPPYSEKYSADQIKITEIGSSSYYAGDSNYLSNSKKITKELKNDLSAFGVVLGFYIKAPYKQRMNAKIKRITAMMKKNGLQSSRYYASVIKTTNWLAAGEPKYPLFYVVKIQQK